MKTQYLPHQKEAKKVTRSTVYIRQTAQKTSASERDVDDVAGNKQARKEGKEEEKRVHEACGNLYISPQ